MVARSVRVFLISSMFLSIGGHLPFLQSLAWTRMAISYSHQSPIGISLQKTFDGHHPCPICLKVNRAAHAGGSLGALRSESTKDMVIPASPFQILRRVRSWNIISPLFFRIVGPIFIDTPPPELVLS
jgi:hypothetical protein